jgi:LuxR family maltose regulon positive regulatory protein
VPETLLQTKLYIPPLRPNLVPRPQLIERLNQGLVQGHKLTLVSAPAGFGKTTLVSEWVAGGERPAAWLSLDEGDNDPTRFLVYLVAALQTVAPNIGEGALVILQSPQPPPTELILTTLLNEITTIPDNFVLVLDDYHVIDAKPVDLSTSVDGALTFTLEHLPPQMHLVIATREDPNLPLARLRASGQLTELRATDLRFTSSEAAEFLNQVMGLNLSAEEIAALEIRTEGWIAGLQMAALSMQGREDVPGFIRAFAGDNRYIVDYLVEEVLQRQPERVRSFLLQTSILDRLSGPLCDAVCFGVAETPSSSEGTAVTGQEDGRGMLEALERGNLFVVPLDDKRQWYRYHHLFADVLHAHLMEEQHNQVPTLHRRASEWYERNGLPSDAVRHALAAEDFERAAGLIELAWPAMDESFQLATWLGWGKALPDELIHARPVLCVGYAWALLNGGEFEAAEARLLDAERWLEPTADMSEQMDEPTTKMVVVDEEQFRSLPVSLTSARAYHAQALGDVPGTVKYARQALDLIPEGDYFARGRASVLLGLAQWASGDLDAAHRSFVDAMASFQMVGNILFAISFTFILADIRMAQGRLHEAISTYEQSLHLAREQGDPALQGTADLYTGLSELHCEQGDLGTARQHLLRIGELDELSDVYLYRWCLAQAQLKKAQGDLDGALDQLDEAERHYLRGPIPDMRPVAALKTRVWVRQGRLTEAQGWTRERGLSVDDELSYLREFEHITLARVHIAQYMYDRVDSSINEAMGLLDRLLKVAEEGGRTGSVIEILVLQALAHEAQDDIPRALDPLARALTLAEPEGYVRIFVDEGPPMAELLTRMQVEDESLKPDEGGRMKEYTHKLLAAFGKQKDVHPFDSAQDKPSSLRLRSGQALRPQPLVEPLSERELEVLRLLGTELNGPEIARELLVSLNTMRTHTKNIYSKLGVNNRRAAVRRAEELDLL